MLAARLRDRFFVPDDAVELRAFTHGLMPRTVPDLLERFAEDWRIHGVDAWNRVPNHWRPDADETVGWWSLPVYLGDRFIAPLLGAPEGTCIHQPNVNWTMQALMSAPEVWTRTRRVVLTEAEFPSVSHTVQRWASLLDLEVKIVPLASDGFVDRAAVLNALKQDTALTILSHVGFTTGEKLTNAFLRDVADSVHRHGGVFVVDGYHATGSVPVDVNAIGADVYFGGLLKEACGSSGNAFVYLRPGLDLKPRLTGWFGNADPFGFVATPTPHPDVRKRFLSGTSAIASMYHAVEGVRILLEAGLEQVRADSLEKTAYAIERADAIGLPPVSPREPERRSAMIILEVPEANRLCAYLKTRRIFTDSRKGRYLRMAPFVWNTRDELDLTFDTISDALSTRSYLETTVSASGPVT